MFIRNGDLKLKFSTNVYRFQSNHVPWWAGDHLPSENLFLFFSWLRFTWRSGLFFDKSEKDKQAWFCWPGINFINAKRRHLQFQILVFKSQFHETLFKTPKSNIFITKIGILNVNNKVFKIQQDRFTTCFKTSGTNPWFFQKGLFVKL